MSVLNEITPDKLKIQYAIWHHNRLEYPGWIICPKENRDTLWCYTEKWINPIVYAIDELSSPYDLLLLYELIWRLEKTFSPIFFEWIEKFIIVLDKYNPFPNLINLENAKFKPNKEGDENFDWNLIREAWIGINFALLTDARRDYDETGFRKWDTYLEKIVTLNSEWQARWYNEQCLFYLSRFELERVAIYLKDWEKISSSNFWEIKRASVIAEIGDLSLAEQIAENALHKIRSCHQPYSTDYALLSQEGWAMFFLKNIKWQKSFNLEEEEVNYLDRDRWEKLDSYRCNPWTELNNLVPILEKPFPKPKPNRIKHRSFFPGTYSSSYNWGSSDYLSKVRPAFELPGILEEAGIPLRMGNIVMYPEPLANAVNWLAPFSPLKSLFLILKLGDHKKAQAIFNYECIATLKQEDATLIFKLLFNAFKYSIENLFVRQNRLDINIEQWCEQQVRILPEILSRIAFRLSTSDIKRLLEFTIQIYQLPLFRDDFRKICHINSLFKNIFYGISEHIILERMPSLLALPIPESNGFSICKDGQLEETFNFIIWSNNTKLKNNYDRSAWCKPILNLIELVKYGTSEARGRAAIRLNRLHEINALTEEEKQLFAEAVWSRVDKRTKLPKETFFNSYMYLLLPKPEYLTEEDIQNKVRHFLLAEELPPLIYEGAYHPSDAKYIKELLYASSSILKAEFEYNEKLINWTSEEAEQLLEILSIWWKSQKRIN